MARIMDVEIDWMRGWANSPRYKVRLDVVHKLDEFRFEERNGLYLATIGEAAQFFYYVSPGDGYGGRVFPLRMCDGTTRSLKGPWSSNSSSINAEYPELQVVEASITDSPQVMGLGYTFFAGSVTVAGLLRWMDENPDRGWGLAKVDRFGDGGVTYEPTLNGLIKSQFKREPGEGDRDPHGPKVLEILR